MAYEEDPLVPPLTVRAAANRLGLSTWAVRRAIDRGELRPVTRHPIQVSADDVEQMRLRKRDEAIARIGLDRMAIVARQVRLQLHPPATSGAPREHAALELISETAKSAFTMPLLHAAAMPDGSGCRWCAAQLAGRMLQVPVSERLLSSDVGIALLGGPECAGHKGLVRGRMNELMEQVHPGRTRLPERPVEAASDVPALGAPYAAVRPSEPSSRPSVGWVPRVRPRAVTAAAQKPGVLRCGHRLAERCSCPRQASR